MVTEATGNQSSETPGTPWEDKWNEVKQAVQTNVVEPVINAVKQPWEDMWGATPQKPQMPNTAPPDKFETVFNNLIGQESGGRNTDSSGKLITSNKGAQGITQVMPKTSGDPGFGVQPLQNKSRAEYIRFGKDYLKAMLNEFDGDYEKALAAYNAGVGNVKKAIAKGGDNWKDNLPKKSETIPYINNILGKQ